jgi:hypothetical protein
MSLAFIVKILCDLSLWFGTAGFIFSFFGGSAGTFRPAAVMVLSCALCSVLKNKKKLLRLSPLAVLLSCAFWVHAPADALLVVPPCIYCAFLCVRAGFSPDYSACQSYYRASSAALLVFVPFAFLIGGTERTNQFVLPYLISFLSCGVLLLRLLRREEKENGEWRLMLINVVSVVLCLAAAFFLSSEPFLQAVGTFFSVLYKNVVTPVIIGVAYLFAALAWLVWRAVSLVGGKIGSNTSDTQMEIGDFNFELFNYTQTGDGKFFGKLILAFAIIAFALLSAMLFKRLIAGYRVTQQKRASMPEIREKIPAGGTRPSGRLPLAPRSPRELVRRYYRKFLQSAVAGGLNLSPSDTSDSIAHSAGSLFDPLLLHELRDLYIVARYSPAVITRDDAQRAKLLYGKLKSKSITKAK